VLPSPFLQRHYCPEHALANRFISDQEFQDAQTEVGAQTVRAGEDQEARSQEG
jgi:predicted transcriptional regulator